jgi:hypothetical protein
VEINWDCVKVQTLWSYEDLIRKLQEVLAYDFVREHYNHTMAQARTYAAAARGGYLQDRGEMTAYVDRVAAHLSDLEWRGVPAYVGLVRSVETRELCAAFIRQTGATFDALIETLNYLLRWVLPFSAPLHEFVDATGDAGAERLEAFKRQGIRSNLNLLESGRSEAGRVGLAAVTGISAASLLMLVHRADISRLAYVRGKTVKHLCGGGYDTLEKIAGADPAAMEERMAAYYAALGKTSADFKAVIPLSWMIGGAGILPRVVTT